MSTLKSNNENMTINADGASSEIILQQNATERMRLDSSGNVGIGWSSPGVKLDTNGDIRSYRTSGTPKFYLHNGASQHSIENNTSNQNLDFKLDGINRVSFMYSGGITFNGDTAVANALDDYEEGTFTPVLSDATSGGNDASGDFAGSYTKIGNQVTIYIRLVNINKSGMTSGNDFAIKNIPFTASFLDSSQYGVGAVMFDRFSFDNYVIAQIGHSHDYIRLRTIDSGNADDGVQVGHLDTSGGSDILTSITYQTA